MPTVRKPAARERLREMVAAVLELDVEEVTAGALFYEDLGADSLEKVEITARIENEFDVRLSAAESAGIRAVEDAVALLEAKQAAGRGAGLVRRLLTGHLAAGRGAAPAYLDPEVGEVSYDRLHAAARGYAGALAAAGVAPGTRGLIVAEDSVATVAAVLGLWWAGCVPVPVTPMLTDAEIAFVARDCSAGVLHLDVSPIRQEALHAGFARLVRLTGAEVREGMRSGAATAAHRPDDAPEPVDPPPGTEALVQYTSGSTGRPKGVRHAVRGITAMLDGFGGVMGLRPDDVVLATARMSFGFGFGSSVLCPLDAGACTALIRGTVDVHAALDALQRTRPTVFCSVPRLYAALLDLVGADGAGFPTLRLCLTAGEHCPPALDRRIRETLGVDLMNCLGATEFMHVVLATPPDRSLPGTVGVPVPGVTVTVRDAEGRPVPDGEEGRLHVAGENVATGYLGLPEATAATFADGGAYSGDVVRRTAEGGVEYLCRADDVLNLGGYKVVPREIETVVRSCEGVADCAVVGAADANGLQQALVYVVADPGAETTRVRRAVTTAVRRGLAVYKRPSRVEFLDALPVTSTGKVAAHALRRRAVNS